MTFSIQTNSSLIPANHQTEHNKVPLLSCHKGIYPGSIWAVKLHWLYIFIYDH